MSFSSVFYSELESWIHRYIITANSRVPFGVLSVDLVHPFPKQHVLFRYTKKYEINGLCKTPCIQGCTGCLVFPTSPWHVGYVEFERPTVVWRSSFASRFGTCRCFLDTISIPTSAPAMVLLGGGLDIR